MNKIAKYFVERPVMFWSFVGVILMMGILSFVSMPKLEDPAVSAKQATVVVPYPGASAHQVELEVAQLLESELRSLPGVKKVMTQCQRGMATFTVEFRMNVQIDKLEEHFTLLRRKVGDTASRLPQGCYDPIVIDDMMDVYGIFYALVSDGFDYPEMNKYAKYLQRELLEVKGVKRINVVGNRDEVINVVIPKENISRNGIVPTQIMSALSSAGSTVNAGSYLSGDERIAVTLNSEIKDENDVRDLSFQTLDGKTLRIGDIAKVERTYSEPQRNGFFVNGHPAMAICIAMEEGAIVPDVGKAVDAKLAEAMELVPEGLSTEKIFFQPDKVSSAISSFMMNLLESVLVVILVLMFTMGFRAGVIIGLGLVLTVAVSFPILMGMGTTLHRISLGAFIVAMGMLVDNAVVIMDGILKDKKAGMPQEKYLYRIGNNTAMPLLGATIIAASTFLCVYLSPDTAGEYAGDLFLVLCVSLVASWVLALVQVPVCSKLWLSPDEKSKDDAFDRKSQNLFRKAIIYLIPRRKTAIAIAVLVLALSGYGMTKVKNLFFPDFDYSQFVVECFFPSDTDANTVRDKMLRMSDTLTKSGDFERVSMSMGSAPAHYCLVRPMTSGGDCYGELIVDCKDYKTVLAQISKVRSELREAYPEAYIRTRKYNFSISTTHTVEAEFTGPDPAVLRELSAQAEEIMRKCEYVDPYSVQNNWKPTGKILATDFLRQDALRSGLGRSDMANAIMAATDGMPAGVINDQERMVTINLQVRNTDGSRIGDLGEIPVWSTMNLHLSNDDMTAALSGGQSMSDLQDKLFRSTPLSNVSGGAGLDWDEDLIHRLNGRRAIEAECDPDPDNDKATPAKVISCIKKDIESIQLPEGYHLRWVGEGEVQSEAIGNILKFVPVTLFIILIILLLLFESWKKLSLILVCLPFVVCGIAPSLLFSNQPMTFMVIVGMMGLVGMMVKNGIVLVDEIGRLQREDHVEPYTAIVEATVSRVRPVLMASLTTIVGIMPLLVDPVYGAMTTAIMGGLAIGTLITLVLLPMMYAAIFHIKPKKENA